MADKEAELTAHRRQLLNKLAETENPVVAQMAKDLLSGRRTPQDVMADPAVGEEFSKGVAQFGQWYERLSETEKDEAAEAGAQRLDEEYAAERAELQPRSTLSRRRRPVEDDGDFSDESMLRRD